jgi:L-asparagine transporter-like permease
LALGLLLAMVTSNLWSTRSYAEFEFWFASIKVAAIIVFILATGAFLFLHAAPPGGRFANLNGPGGFAPFGIQSVIAGVTSVIFALVGAEIATIAAAESGEPGRAIGRMTSQVAVRILLFYVLSILLIVTIVPWREIHPGDSPFAITLGRLGIPYVSLIMNAVVLTAVLSCLNSGLYVSSRVLFTLAARGDAPTALIALSRRRVPVRAVLIASAFAIMAGAASVLSPDGVFLFLINTSGALMLLIYLMVAMAEIRVRRRLDAEKSPRLTIRMWLFPFGSYFTLAAILAILVAMALSDALRIQLVASLGVLVLALAVFFGRARLRSAA